MKVALGKKNNFRKEIVINTEEAKNSFFLSNAFLACYFSFESSLLESICLISDLYIL